jgi:serine/threonine protein kinase
VFIFSNFSLIPKNKIKLILFRNILLKNNKIKLADLGSSKEIGLNKLSQGQGTICYRSPEIISGCEYDGRTDVWSSGCVLFELVFLEKYSLCLDNRNFNKSIPERLFILIKS